jgi:serine/threonine protein kinase
MVLGLFKTLHVCSLAFWHPTEGLTGLSYRNTRSLLLQKLKILGQGAAGTVYLVLLRGTDKLYAMKELTKEGMVHRKKIARVKTEREILATVNHPFVVTLYAINLVHLHYYITSPTTYVSSVLTLRMTAHL